MKKDKLSGYDIYDFIISGARQIIHHEDTLNDINVFPIPDSDTGSNLTLTMKCIIAKATRTEHLGETLTSISYVAIEDSFGNSGTIFASFLHGLSKAVAHKPSITTVELAHATTYAASQAYEAVLEPEEGTILTVMREWSQFLEQHVHEFPDIKLLFLKAFEHTQAILDNTKHQLGALKEANVVDAGALGFVYFLEGILEKLDSKATNLLGHKNYSHPIHPVNHKAITYRYCCEFLVESNEAPALKRLPEHIETTADSIVIQSKDAFTKIHCHTNTPMYISEYLKSCGSIIKSKVDDMLLQQSISRKPRSKIGIVTDSIADYPEDWLLDHHIMQIPLQLNVAGHTFTDRKTVNPESLYKEIESAKACASSGQPGNGEILKALEFMLKHYDHVLGIFVSSKMSGLYSNILAASKNLDQTRLTLIDSRQNSASQGLLLYDAVNMIQQNKSIHHIRKALGQSLDKYKIYVEIPDLSYAVASGRVPRIIGSLSSMFRLKVIISINKNGKGIVCPERSFDQILKKIQSRHIKEYVIVHSSDPIRAEKYAEELEGLLGMPPVFINEVSSVVGAFVGKGAIGIGYKE